MQTMLGVWYGIIDGMVAHANDVSDMKVRTGL